MPRFSTIAAAAIGAASIVSAGPVIRQEATYDDGTILQYALTLEHLEATFYRQGLNKYSAQDFENAGYQPWARERVTEIASHEKAHVDFLTAGLTAAGASPVAECTYNFPDTDPKSFIAVSQIFEGVGVSAYLGAAPSITNKAYLGAAASILLVEQEHKTWVDSTLDTQDPFPVPFAAGLDFNQVYTLVAPFIASCPSTNAPLPFHTFPSITIETPGPAYCIGETISFKIDQSIVDTAKNNGQTLYAAFVSAQGTVYTEVDSNCGSVVVPDNVGGESFLIIVNGKFLCDAATVAGPAILQVDIPARNFAY